MTTRVGLRPVVLGTLAVAAAYGSAFAPGGAPRWAPWAMIVGIALTTVGLMALGASRPGRRSRVLLIPLGFTFVVLLGGFGLALALPGGEGPATPLLAGLPPRAALILYGIGLLPALVLPLAYALTFRRMTLDEADIERIRAVRAAESGGGSGR